ncbi:Pre-mRNA-splicing factor of RES complex-domain-containing protein [Hypoxylon argillaceum]|nr:Pre-mRNA-splicing factor of RES complex-domain-containing protein [Hypoxylon argillaceum]KAI1149286.1 Pre-mRNA-splicing factor of RES complex-domain-containing protein [Nemania diffusa]
MPSDLSSYLATHYLTADPKPSKKRKRKQAPGTGGLIIADDDETGWSRSRGDDDDDETAPNATVAGTSAEFRKAKKSGWKALGGASSSSTTTTPPTQPPAQDEATRQADAILASAAAESAAAAADDDPDAAPVMMSDGTYAGLQSGATVSAQLARRRAAERAEYERSGAAGGKPHKEAETIYRDATGRRVDVSMKRAELRREADEAARKREDAELALRGDVQVADARRRRAALDDAKVMAVARHADDADMNADMRAQVRWGDTMAAFVKPKDDGGGGSGRRVVKGRPVYQGAWAPNRYQIPPGYRWDGVVRGNGFEAERFKALNRRERNKNLDYSWQMDE